MQNEITGVEVESVDELSEGDRITVVYDTHIEIEQTGTDYKIPETEMQEDHIRVDDALIDDISEGGFAGELMVHITECSDEEQAGAADGIPMWVNEDGVTVIKHDEGDDMEEGAVDEYTYTNGSHDHEITLSVGDKLRNTDGDTAEVERITLTEVHPHESPLAEVGLGGDVDETTAMHTLEAAVRKGNVEIVAAGQ